MAFSQELLNCSICLHLLEDPVTTSCGHSYCIKCIDTFWDSNNTRGRAGFSCPECRHTFFPKPVLKRNTILNNLLEEHRRTTGQSAAADEAGDTYATPGDVQCDICTGRKRKACMFCLVCLASYCEIHLKPHLEVLPLKKHKLTQASEGIKDSICSRHDKLLEIYCRSDQQFICLLCVVDGHKGHDTVAVTAEKCAMQRQLDCTKQEIADRLLDSEGEMAKLSQAAHYIRDAAWEACNDFERLCAEHIRSVRRKCTEMREKVGEAEKTGVDWTNGHLGRLQREVLELRQTDDKLDQLSLTENPIQFLQGFQALVDLPVLTDLHERPDTVTGFVTALKDDLEKMCNKEMEKLFSHSEITVLSIMPSRWEDLTSRTYLLTQYSKVEVDPNTVAACLCLSDSNSEIWWSGSDQAHPDHPDRFTFSHQALCKKGLKGSHYWEVEWDGGVVDLAVSYKGIKRKGSGRDCSFGHNDLSWKLNCTPTGCTFWHNNLHKSQIPPAHSRRVGIYLNSKVGILCFYSASDQEGFTLLHKIHTTFTEPLFPGFSVDFGSTLKICNV